MNKEILFAQTLEQVRKTAKEQGELHQRRTGKGCLRGT